MSRQPLGRRAWESISFASGVLGPLQDHAAAYLPLEDAIAIVGGRDSCDDLAPLTKWYGIDVGGSKVWSYRALDRIFGATVAYDPVSTRLLVFGGRSNTGSASAALVQIDLRQGLERGAFQELRAPGDRPPGRYHHAAAYDPERDWLVVYGGVSDELQPISETVTWVYQTGPGRWTALEGASVGRRFGAAMVYDSHHHAVLLVGGTQRGPREAVGTIHALVCSEVSPATATEEGGAAGTATSELTAVAATATQAAASTATAAVDATATAAVDATATAGAHATATAGALHTATRLADGTATALALPTATVWPSPTATAGWPGRPCWIPVSSR